MRCLTRINVVLQKVIAAGLFLSATTVAFGQVSPSDIKNPKLKTEQAEYLPQLQSLQQSIMATQFPFSFVLTRYLNALPGQRAASDRNGIEFVYFHQHVVLKISGIYKAALNANTLTENERASRTFQDVVTPILNLISKQVSPDIDCDGIGFEIAFDTRDANRVYDYEGREVLTVVFKREDTFAYAKATGDAERQAILNRSEIFVQGRDFGLALGQRDPLNVEALERSVPHPSSKASATFVAIKSYPAVSSSATAAPVGKPAVAPRTAEQLQALFQPQLDAILKQDGESLQLVDTAPPAFEDNKNEIALHFTMRNTTAFASDTSSIYRRAAQSFDLFLAPKLKDVLGKLPAGAEGSYITLVFSVLNHGSDGKSPFETIDYICPLNSVRSFVEDRITSQDLIDQSIVLVHGVRIGLNLQIVE